MNRWDVPWCDRKFLQKKGRWWDNGAAEIARPGAVWGIRMADFSGIAGLIEKLQRARFNGGLSIRMEAGAVASAKLEQYIPIAEFSTRELVTVR